MGETTRPTTEQQARDLLERCGVEDPQTFSAGDLIELANFIDHADTHRSQIERIRTLAATWAVDDDTYLSLDGQDLGYADAAVQIIAIIDNQTGETPRPTTEQIIEVLPEKSNGYEVFAKCLNCGEHLTINGSQWFVHVTTYDRNCRKTSLAKPDRHQRWAQW